MERIALPTTVLMLLYLLNVQKRASQHYYLSRWLTAVRHKQRYYTFDDEKNGLLKIRIFIGSYMDEERQTTI